MAPHIDRKNLQKKTLHSGQVLKIEADVKGEPAPVVTWKLKDKVLQSADRLKIENEDNKTNFSILKVKRADAGTYTVFAKNDSGTDQVDVEIEVLGTVTFWERGNFYTTGFTHCTFAFLFSQAEQTERAVGSVRSDRKRMQIEMGKARRRWRRSDRPLRDRKDGRRLRQMGALRRK